LGGQICRGEGRGPVDGDEEFGDATGS
jgi:hypothetical protein